MIKYLENDYDEFIKGKKVLVDFYADWCGPCKMLGEVLKEVENEIDMDILKVNVDDFPEIAKRYGILSIPSIYLIDNTDVINNHIGFMTKSELIEFINQKK